MVVAHDPVANETGWNGSENTQAIMVDMRSSPTADIQYAGEVTRIASSSCSGEFSFSNADWRNIRVAGFQR